MKLTEFSDASDFSERVRSFYLEREAECCVELGILYGLVHHRPTSARGHALDRPLLWAVTDDRGEVVATMVQSVRDRLLVSRGPEAAIDLIARRLAEIDWPGTQLIGAVPAIDRLAAKLTEYSGRATTHGMSLRTFELREVTAPRAIDGAMRRAAAGDRETLARWALEFSRDIGDPVVEAEGPRTADSLLADERAWLWCDDSGRPQGMAAHAGRTPNGIRVNFVYTPPEMRGRGVASNLVAALSAHHLASGCRFCFLHTDLANPTSNHIYQSIGYRGVCDSARWNVTETAINKT